MKTETKDATCGSARGKTFNPPLEFKVTFTTYETTDELVAAKDELTLDEQMKFRNDARLTKARTAEQNRILDEMGIEKQTYNNNDLLRLKTMFDVLMSAKIYTKEQARELAATHLNLSWPED